MQYGKFAAVYDRLMQDVDYDAWSAYLASFLPPGAVIAECACGTGALTLRLARRGFGVTGFDLSPDMLEQAAKKAREAGLKVPFICQDMRRLALHRPVDAVISACDGVNYLASRQDLSAFFAAAFAALKPGGLLLFDLSSRYKLEHILAGSTFGEDDGDTAYLWKNAYDPESRLLQMDLSFFLRQGALYERFTERHIQRAHSALEVRTALLKAGFCDPALYAAFSREAPASTEERLQFAAQKPQ